MQLKDLISINYVMDQHAEKLLKLGEKDVDELSISELAFIKMVSSGSITAMKKRGYYNSTILNIEQSKGIRKQEKIKSYLKSLSPENLTALLDEIKD